MNAILPLALAVLAGSFGLSAAYAHTTVSAGPYDIEVGWGTEPPVEGLRNTIVFEISRPGDAEGVKSGVNDGFRSLQATVMYGGLSKTLDVNADTRAGHYYSPIIPTRAGSMEVNVRGEISGVSVDVVVPVEDVETTAVLDFPPRTAAGGEDVTALKAAVVALQGEMAGLESGRPGSSADTAYDIAVFGMSLGAAGVILAVIAMTKARRNPQA